MSAEYSAGRLLRLLAHLTVGSALPSGDREAIAAGIAQYFDQRCSLDQALGLQLDSGECHPGVSLAIAARDAALRAAAQLGGCSPAELADRLSVYQRGPWKRESVASECPPHRDGQVEGCFWIALKAWPRPIGERQISNILKRRDNPWK